MTETRQPGESDPWQEPDPPLALAMRQMHWYGRQRDRARRALLIDEILFLLVTAATTVAAALGARPVITASLAATSLVLAGLRKIFDWQYDWIVFAAAWVELKTAVDDYRLLPEDQKDKEAGRRLVAKMNEVINADTGRWAARRRVLAAQHE